MEGSVTSKPLQDISRIESRFLGAHFKLDDFLNPQVRTCSATIPGTSRNNDSGNQELTGDHSQKDPCPEGEFSVRQSSNSANSDQDDFQIKLK